MVATSLHVLSSTHRRGAEVFAMELQESLSSGGRSAAAVALLDGTGQCFDVPVLGASRRSLRSLAALRARAKTCDVAVAHGSKTLPHCAVALAGSTPFVYANIGDPRFWASSPSRLARVRFFLGRAAAVAAISDTAREVLIDYVGIAPQKVATIPNGRCASRFHRPSSAERSAARARFCVPDGAPTVVMLAALSREKRIDVAIEAIASWPEAVLLVAGAGPLREALEQQAAQAAPGRVVFAGSVSDPEAVLAAGDVLLLTSESEGVPGCLIEAGLSGLPSVATSVGFCHDVVAAGQTGHLVSPGDVAGTIDALRDAWARRHVMGAAAHSKCIERFELDVVARQWAQLLDDVHDSASRARRARPQTGDLQRV